MELQRPEELRLGRAEQELAQVTALPQLLAQELEEPRQLVFVPQQLQRAAMLRPWEVLAVVLLKEARPRP